ncbi:hypothetical protein [Streptomyces sp. NPDC055400]
MANVLYLALLLERLELRRNAVEGEDTLPVDSIGVGSVGCA